MYCSGVLKFYLSITAFANCSNQLHKSAQVAGLCNFRLMIYAAVPEASGIDVSSLLSPVATLASYQGSSSDVTAPQWTRITPGVPLELRQDRGSMAQTFVTIVFWPENRQFVSAIGIYEHLN